ncbi:hypothetical protein [Modestobacter roseus]|uniref:Uncharacterized protein n=1 Tax=Modestobacter roseus TaxID=1181884 RepID=A0A562IQD9_9ACTN|nr:hypothetical protein [Modestobacter roseus]TWH72933.1 hypothetical protein JD78_01456 [Modestobacter roseus]
MTWTVDGEEETAELPVAADGRLLGVGMQRWGTARAAEGGFSRARITGARFR